MYRTLMMFFFSLFVVFLGVTQAGAAPRIAVADLSYEERVQTHFRALSVDYRHTRTGGRWDQNEERDLVYDEQEGSHLYIDRGALHQWTADIKGELLRAGYQVVQARPFSMKEQAKLFDVIGRIKQGEYKGADYVLFGTVSSVAFREESSPVAGTARTFSESLSLELVVEFSLIHTRSHAVVAAFSAMGEGSDVRLRESAAARVRPSRGKAIMEAAKGLALDVVRQMPAQMSGYTPEAPIPGGGGGIPPAQEEVTIYR